MRQTKRDSPEDGASSYTTKAQLRSGRRNTNAVPDLHVAPEQPEDLLFDLTGDMDVPTPDVQP